MSQQDRPLIDRQANILCKFLDRFKHSPVSDEILKEWVTKIAEEPLFENPSPILQKPKVPIYKPFKYPEAYEAWLKQKRVEWLPEEVNMSEDIKDWQALSPIEIYIYTSILRFFVTSDVEVGGAYINLFLRAFHHIDIRMMLTVFANIETVHIAAYAHLLDSVGMPESEYASFLEYKEMVDKFNYYESFKMGSVRDLIIAIMLFSGFTEGMQLYSSFAILLNPSRTESGGKLRGVAQIVSWSIRDETHHTNSMMAIGRRLIEENPHLWDDEAKNAIREVGKTMVHHEDCFIRLVMAKGEPKGLTEADLKQYMRFLCDTRCKAIGIEPIFNVTNPLPWINDMMSNEHASFFEADSTDYSRASTLGEWTDDIYKI